MTKSDKNIFKCKFTKEQLAWLENIRTSRQKLVDVSKNAFAQGIWASIVDKYSDQAHFIYELLQNADDTCATEATFNLFPNKLIFLHNGTRYFTISPNDEHKPLGDMNSITAISLSTKALDENKIGKFGVGFKAVFQYTNSPHICDPNISFTLLDYIVPQLNDHDIEGRKPNETAFEFPFDTALGEENSYNDVKSKLNNLIFPNLFLRNLKKISINLGKESINYVKTVSERKEYDSATFGEHISLSSPNEKKKLWLFTRKIESNNSISVGFFINDKEDEILPATYDAFCFFPTHTQTKQKFIIHAPFLLNDSRESIKAANDHNKKMICELAKLAADSLVFLRDIDSNFITEKLLYIIPYCEDDYKENESDKISFKPFYTEIKAKLTQEQLIPSLNGKLIKSDEAAWAHNKELANLFSNDQLFDLIGKKWAFANISKDELERYERWPYSETRYIRELCNENVVYFRDILLKISSEFLNKQNPEWLDSFYKYIYESKDRIYNARTATIFLNEKKEAVAAFDEYGKKILFIEREKTNAEAFDYIHPDLFKLEYARQLAFYGERGYKLGKPTNESKVYLTIIPELEEKPDSLSIEKLIEYLENLVTYYNNCYDKYELDRFISKLKKLRFILCESETEKDIRRPISVYYPSEHLKIYFSAISYYRQKTYFLHKCYLKNYDKYSKLLHEVGVLESPAIIEIEYNYQKPPYNADWSMPTKETSKKWNEKTFLGCIDAIKLIVSNKDKDLSIVLFEVLTQTNNFKLQEIKYGEYTYRISRQKQSETYVSLTAKMLREEPWLLNKNNEFVAAKDCNVNELSSIYNSQRSESMHLIDFLNFKALYQPEFENDNEKGIRETSSNVAKLVRLAVENGIPANYISNQINNIMINLIEQYEHSQQSKIYGQTSTIETDNINDEIYAKPGQEVRKIPEIEKAIMVTKENNSETYDDIGLFSENNELFDNSALKRILSKQDFSVSNDFNVIAENSELDADLETDVESSVQKQKDIEKKQNRLANQYKENSSYLEKVKELNEKARKLKRYTYEWFKTLLELEICNESEYNSNSKEISISFGKVDKYKDTDRTLKLDYPNKPIPAFIEELTDIKLQLKTKKDETANLIIDGISIQSYSIHVKAKDLEPLKGIQYSDIVEAIITANNPTFVLTELLACLKKLEYDNNFNMRNNLPSNIEFIFGPPGTGKTTYLANNVIIPIIENEPDARILVLTPTNKAADVITKRIIECMDSDLSYNMWLTRFVNTNDEELEKANVVKERTFPFFDCEQQVVVSTIARFSYDYFINDGKRYHLKDLRWDYIVIDEASMIAPPYIIYPLYKKTPKKFIIAGDPFQIDPIVREDLWKDENIYTMVGLNKPDSFINPQTVPHQYKVVQLTKQYRSIPDIGEIFSKFTYNGVLKHNRTPKDKLNLNFGPMLNLENVNMVKFPVKYYESIYKVKRLNDSPYQIYSALFAYEFVKYIALQISANNKGNYSIGIICPYKVQANIIDKLMIPTLKSIPSNINISAGTIHGFQGDECDIIVALFNPPPKISGDKVFINKKNIINVAISRARDYLFVLMPDDNTKDINNAYLLKGKNGLEELCKKSSSFAEFDSHNLESIFAPDHSKTYLEENTFSTSHQSVNVYDKPQRRYEIRSESDAIDIQIIKQ